MEDLVIAVVAIGCATGIINNFIGYLRTRAERAGLGAKGAEAILEELRGMREELRQTRLQTNDVILSFDTTLHRLDQRITRMEQNDRAGVTAKVAPEEEIVLSGRR